MLVIHLGLARMPHHAVGRVGLRTPEVIRIGIQRKRKQLAQRQFRQRHPAAKQRSRSEVIGHHHLVASHRVESRHYRQLVSGIDITPRQCNISTKPCRKRHIVAIAGFQVRVTHIRGMGIHIIAERIKLHIVGTCDASGVGQPHPLHHVGRVISHIQSGEQVAVTLLHRASGIESISIFIAQPRFGRPPLRQLACRGGINRTHILRVVEWIPNRVYNQMVYTVIFPAPGLSQQVVGMRQCPLGTRLHHETSCHKPLPVHLGTVNINHIVRMQRHVHSRIVVRRHPPQRVPQGEIPVGLAVLRIGDIVEIVQIGRQFRRLGLVEDMRIIQITHILRQRILRHRVRQRLLQQVAVHPLNRETRVVPLPHAVNRHGENNPYGVFLVYKPVVAHLQCKPAALHIGLRPRLLLKHTAAHLCLSRRKQVHPHRVAALRKMNKSIGLFCPEIDPRIQIVVEKELCPLRPYLHLAVKPHARHVGRNRAVQPLGEMMCGLDIDNASLAFGVIFSRGVGHNLYLLNIAAVGATQQHLEALPVQVRRTSVNPHRHSLPVEQHIAVLVHTHSRCFAQQIHSIASLCKGALGHIHHQLVHLLLHHRSPLHHLHGLQHRGVGRQHNGLHLHRRFTHRNLAVGRLVTYKRNRQNILSLFFHTNGILALVVGHRSGKHRAVLIQHRHRRERHRLTIALIYHPAAHRGLSLHSSCHAEHHQKKKPSFHICQFIVIHFYHLFFNTLDKETHRTEPVIAANHGAIGILHPSVKKIALAPCQCLHKLTHRLPRLIAHPFGFLPLPAHPSHPLLQVASMLYNVFIHRLQILVVRFPNSCYLHIFHAANLHKNFDIHAHPTK